MTTIAYKDGVIAYDSRFTRGDLITNDKGNKRADRNGVIFFYCGAVSDLEYLFAAYFDKDDVPEDCQARAFAVKSGKVVIACAQDGEFWIDNVEEYDSIGSGSLYALTAMDCGLSAVDAVKMAAKRDVYTGGKIRSYKVK